MHRRNHQLNILYIGSLKCVIGAIARATHRANMQQTAGGRSQAIGSLNVCGCNGLPGSDCRCCCSDPMAPPVDSCSIVLSAYGCLCAFVQTTQATCEDRRSYRFDRVSPESVLRALPWKHRRVHCQSSECRELRMDESVMVSSVSGQRTGCVGLLLRDRHARPFSVCLSSHALLAGQAGPRRFYASVQPNQRQRPGRHVGSIRGRSAAAGCMGDG
jgi:hypothetical protein